MSLDPLQTIGPGQSCALVQNGGSADTSAWHVQRNASAVVGGMVGFTNSATVTETIVGPGDLSDEWVTLTKLATSGTGENVGGYIQVEANGVGQTVWGDCVEVRDNSVGNTNALVGRETDLTGGDANSIGHDYVIDNPQAIGLRVGPPAAKAGQSISSAMHITANCTGGVLKLKSNQALAINEEGTAGIYLGHTAVALYANGIFMIFNGNGPPTYSATPPP